jgi:transposase
MQSEIEILRAENLALSTQLQRQEVLLRRKDNRIERLEEQIRLQILARFGRKSEVYENPLQPSLFDEVDTEVAQALSDPDDGIAVGPYQKKRGHRRALPDILPRQRLEHDLDASEKFCALHGEALVKIGEDVSEQLEIVPEQIKVIQHVRPKYKCPCCEGGIKQRLMPRQPIPGSMASPSLLAYICVSKYVDHLPLFRLEKKFERIFVDLPRLTMARWMIKLTDILTPLYNLLQDDLMAGGILQMDETTIQVLKEPGRSAPTKSYMWVRARDGTTGPPIVLYDYVPSRGGAVVKKLLTDYCGILQTDGYAAYDAFVTGRDVVHVGCLAHCRRKFWEAFKAAKKDRGSFAEQGLIRIKSIYKVETEAKQMTPEDRLVHRQTVMGPLFAEFKDWIDATINKVPSSLKTGEALSYISGEWPKLVRVLEDGRIPLDTNFVESRIRPFTIGRKNWIFSDTPAGAHASAMIYSIVETAKANGVEPFSYLQHVIENLPRANSAADVEALLPQNFAKRLH